MKVEKTVTIIFDDVNDPKIEFEIEVNAACGTVTVRDAMGNHVLDIPLNQFFLAVDRLKQEVA